MGIWVKIALVSFGLVLVVAAFHALFISTRAERKVYRRSLKQSAPEAVRVVGGFKTASGAISNVARRLVPNKILRDYVLQMEAIPEPDRELD